MRQDDDEEKVECVPAFKKGDVVQILHRKFPPDDNLGTIKCFDQDKGAWHVEHDGQTLDELASTTHIDRGESWPEWSRRADEAISVLIGLIGPTEVIVGGGASETWPEWGHLVSHSHPVRAAEFGNRAGVVGAALAALAASAGRL